MIIKEENRTDQGNVKIAIILRGIPGSGKSTLASLLAHGYLFNNDVVCESDKNFIDDKGNYNFDIEKLNESHEKCLNQFKELCEAGIELVVCSNTNTREKDVNSYREIALKNNYVVQVLTVENWHEGVNTHNVPEKTLIGMKRNLQNSIKL
jgi:adenylylsulfate kinase-like enzyme